MKILLEQNAYHKFERGLSAGVRRFLPGRSKNLVWLRIQNGSLKALPIWPVYNRDPHPCLMHRKSSRVLQSEFQMDNRRPLYSKLQKVWFFRLFKSTKPLVHPMLSNYKREIS